MSPTDADGMANNVDPDQTARVCTVCPGISVPKLRIITVQSIRDLLHVFFLTNFKWLYFFQFIYNSFYIMCDIHEIAYSIKKFNFVQKNMKQVLYNRQHI